MRTQTTPIPAGPASLPAERVSLAALNRAFSRLVGDPIPMDEVARFFDTLSVLLRSGMLISEAVRRAGASSGPEMREISEAVWRPMAAGVPLHRALDPFKRRLPPIVLPVLEVGAVSGTLESSSVRLAGTFGQAAEFDRRFRYTVFDAKLVIAILALQSVALSLSAGAAAAILAALTTAIWLGGIYVAWLVGYRFARRWEPFRLLADSIKLAIPHAGTVARNTAAARWARSFATCWNAGVPISESLEVSAKSALNSHYERALRHAALQTRRGLSLHESLASTQLLPAYLLDIIATGESTGKLGQSLDQFAAALEEEALTRGNQEMMTAVAVIKVLLVVTAVLAVLR